MENSWSKNYTCNYRMGDSDRADDHYLENKLMNLKIPITEEQYNSIQRGNSDECTNLANSLMPKQSA